MFDVFISHSSRDRLVADALKHGLEASCVRAWKAPDNILPGQIWEEAITDAISQCRVSILIWSAESQSSVQVKRELTLAASLGKAIIPFRIEDIRPEGSFAYYLTNTHWLDAFSTDQEAAILEAVVRIKKIISLAEAKSSEEFQLALNERCRTEENQLQDSLTSSISGVPSKCVDSTDSILIEIIRKRLNEITLDSGVHQNVRTDPSIAHVKACDVTALALQVPLSMRGSHSALIQFAEESLVVTIDDKSSIPLPRTDLFATVERDQRIRFNAVSLITSKLSRDQLQNLKDCVNMWSNRYKQFPECKFSVCGFLLRAYWNSDANSYYYPEVTSMADVLCEEDYGIEHFRQEPEGLGPPVAEFYLEHLGQGVYIYKDWIELYFSRNEPLRQFCFVHINELNEFIAHIDNGNSASKCDQWNYFASSMHSSLAEVLGFWSLQCKLMATESRSLR